MIKDFNTYINEDYFSKLANRKETGDVRKENQLTEDVVRSYILPGQEEFVKNISITTRNGKKVVDIDGSFLLREDITEIPFQFGEVSGSFNCSSCACLTSLKGCPEIVVGDFSCSHCGNLTSLEGCPKEVGKNFNCSCCKNLISLEGCPKEVGDNFRCFKCGKKFEENEVMSICNVKGKIFVL